MFSHGPDLFRATRLRLALWYTLVTAILLVIFASGVYIYVRGTLVERIDDTLKHVVEVVERSLVIESISPTAGRYRVNVESSFRDRAVTREDDRIELEWFDHSGDLVWSTFSEPPTNPIHLARTGETVHLSDDYLLRQVTKRLEVGRFVLGYLRVSHPWFEVTKPIRQLSVDLFLAISLIASSVAALGWFLSGLAIQPVRDSYQSLKQFTADASHELRNPIATIQANVQLALTYPEGDIQQQQRQLKVVERLTRRLGRLVNDLLFLARADSGTVQTDWQTVPLDALLIEVMEEQRASAEQKDLFLVLKIEDPRDQHFSENEQFNLLGDWEQLARLFTNLISNALIHTAPKPRQESGITIKLRSQTDRLGNLEVTVSDTGCGIPATELSQIFERFYRVDRARSRQQATGGSGLGLAIARAIVTNHRGKITVSSQENQGTTFTVTLPRRLSETQSSPSSLETATI